jgi:hypothetical protein
MRSKNFIIPPTRPNAIGSGWVTRLKFSSNGSGSAARLNAIGFGIAVRPRTLKILSILFIFF